MKFSKRAQLDDEFVNEILSNKAFMESFEVFEQHVDSFLSTALIEKGIPENAKNIADAYLKLFIYSFIPLNNFFLASAIFFAFSGIPFSIKAVDKNESTCCSKTSNDSINALFDKISFTNSSSN
jgi:hypothetical protein